MTTEENPAGEATDGVQGPATTTSGAFIVTHAPDVPDYLSATWWQLPADDWRRQAAIVVAANRWAAIAATPYGEFLLEECLDLARRRTFSEWSSAVSAMCKGRTAGPSHAELERRRAVLGPLHREYAGGPVNFWTGETVSTSDMVPREAA